MKKSYKKILLNMIDGKEYLSDKFNRATNNKNVDSWGHKNIPESWIKIHYKTYPRLNKVKLAKVFPRKEIPLLHTLKNRRSIRMFSNTPISAKDLSYLLLYSSGIVDSKVAELLDLELVKEVPLYMIAVGRYV